jgi:hypothetical protein
MTADHTHSPPCVVCHRRITVGESYLIRLSGGRASAVHQHLCFPPSAARQDAGLARAA